MKLKALVGLLAACTAAPTYAKSQDQQDHLGQWLNEFMSLQPAPISEREQPVNLTTKLGTIEGRTLDGVNTFRGIKYAEAPIGKLRFAPPVATQAWTGTKDASKFGSACMQMGEGNISEDCLYLNIWSPSHSQKEKLPVYVFIHGGGFGMGSGSQALYDGKQLAKQGIIVVTLNYRLGAFGFLPSKAAYDENGTTGNWGLLDVIEALKWVNNNIADFGGNPQQITIGGESAGSFAVSAMINSPLARGLFQQAIMQSGSLPNAAAVAPFTASSMSKAQDQAGQYFSQFNLTDNNKGLDALRAIPAKEIISTSLSYSDARMPQVTSFWPIPDGHVYLTNPSEAIKSGNINQVNLLAGYNSNEGSLFITPQATENDYKTILNTVFKEKADMVYSHFPIDNNNPLRKQMDNVITLSMLRSGLYQYADSLSGRNNVYLYHFGYADPMVEPTGLGVVHGSEIRYITHNLMDFINKNSDATSMANMMQAAWVNFIKTGNPNKEKGLTNGSSWEKYSAKKPQELYLTPDATMQIAPDLAEVKLINSLLPHQN